MRMSDCVQGGRRDNTRGVGTIEEKTMVGGTSGCVSAHSISCGDANCGFNDLRRGNTPFLVQLCMCECSVWCGIV